MPEDLKGAVDWIQYHAAEEDLDQIINAVKQRRKTLAAAVVATLAPGIKVEITNIQPKVYDGLTGTFKERERRGSRCSIMLDELSTRKLRHYNMMKYPPDKSIPEDAKEYLVRGLPMQSLRPC